LGCPVVHRTGPVDCPVHLLRVLCPLRAQARIKCVAVDRCVRSSRCSASTPDTVRCAFYACSVLCARRRTLNALQSIVVCEVVVAPLAHRTLSGASPDSPMNYSGAAAHFPEGEEFSVEFPGAPDTVRWHTGQSDAPDQGAFGMSLALFI
jgi:hypothetical protein